MARGTVHIVGAGLSGLAAAVELAGAGVPVVLHELARHAGGRCRSFFEPALGLTIDNGNHLLLSGNHAARSFLRRIGTEDGLVGPDHAAFAFADLASGERFVLRPNDGALPWWIFARERRVPGTKARDYVPLAKLLFAADRPIGEVIDCNGPLYERLLRPVLLAALNTEPAGASAKLAGAVLKETLARGGSFCRPLIARDGLGPVFIDPALRFLDEKGASVRFDHKLRKIDFVSGRAALLDFGEDRITLGEADRVILAVPAWVAPMLLPEIAAPTAFRAIVNLHFKAAPRRELPPIMGLLNGTAEWLFAFPDRLSVTISAGDRFIETPREELATKIWSEIAPLAGLGSGLPPWCIIKERRATFAALPAENAKRPPAETRWPNLFLAGDWTATGLPATIEGSIRAGNLAADLVRRTL